MKISLAKLKAIIIFFAENTNPQYLGKIKLMKLFYYLDFMHVKKYGIPVTGDQYFHLDKGPIPSSIMNLVGELATDPEASRLAGDVTVINPAGTRMLRVTPLRKFNGHDEDLLGKSELIVLKEVVSKFKDYTTDEIIDASHSEAPWSETKYGQEIPYDLASHDADSLYTEEEVRLLQKITG